MVIIRFLLRFLLVPLGGFFAAVAATVVVCVANWAQFLKLVADNPDAPENLFLAVIMFGPVVLALMAIGSFAMLTPAAIGVMIAEIFAIRSILYHAGSGAVASWLGWVVMQPVLKDYEFYKDPSTLVAAGVAAGLVYWVIAGWTSGFWKPVFSSPPAAPPTAAPAA